MGKDVRTVQELVARINASERLRSSAHFSDMVYRGEPIIRTGRQMASFLPERYREMRAISRYQTVDGRGRWLSEAELFYRQARFMEDFEDDCPYQGRFASYYPTYNDMSDRQLRGYFTWRSAVRHGDVQETCLSFAYIYLYELICGVGVDDPLDGYTKMRAFWHAYRAFEPSMDRFARAWLHDYVIYHGLDPHLLADDPGVAADTALAELIRISAPFDPGLGDLAARIAPADPSPGSTPLPPASSAGTRRGRAPALPLPPDAAFEQRMVDALAAVSTYRIKHARLWREHEDDLRHVLCAVYVRMLAYYRKNRTHGFIEASFGEEAEMSYTMFGSAVFFEERRHPDVDYILDPIRSYRCCKGYWTCRRIYGGRDKSSSFGALAKAVDGRLRDRMGFQPGLKEQKVPKYLAQIIDREIDEWLTWKVSHAPRRIEIDLSQLGRIRSAAAETREALLIDEEREDGEQLREAPPEPLGEPLGEPLRANWADEHSAPAAAATGAEDGRRASAPAAASPTPAAPGIPAPGATPPAVAAAPAPQVPATQVALAPAERTYLQALLTGAAPPVPSGTSQDLLVDAINEKLFDILGDTALEYGEDGPRLIEDYIDDIREVVSA